MVKGRLLQCRARHPLYVVEASVRWEGSVVFGLGMTARSGQSVHWLSIY